MSSFNLLNSPLYVKGKEDKIRIIDLLISLFYFFHNPKFCYFEIYPIYNENNRRFFENRENIYVLY